MQVRCIKAFGKAVPGDTAEVPDGAQVSPVYWEPVTGAEPPGPPVTPDPAPALTPAPSSRGSSAPADTTEEGA